MTATMTPKPGPRPGPRRRTPSPQTVGEPTPEQLLHDKIARNLGKSSRNQQEWAELTSPACIDQTYAIMCGMQVSNQAVLDRRLDDWAAAKEELAAQDREELFTASIGGIRRCRRFNSVVHAAMFEVRVLLRERREQDRAERAAAHAARNDDQMRQAQHRRELRRTIGGLRHAIYLHRQDAQQSGRTPTDADRALWAVLERDGE